MCIIEKIGAKIQRKTDMKKIKNVIPKKEKAMK